MVLFLDIWSAMILGILYLSFGGLPYVFREQYGFSLQQTGLAFLGIGLGQVVAVLCQPLFNRYVCLLLDALDALIGATRLTSRQYRRIALANGGKAPPETRLIPGFFGAVLAPLGLLLFGLTSFQNVPWIIPILATTLFGAGMVFAFTSTFTYLVE